MNTGKKAAFLVLLMMLSSGCLGAIEDAIDELPSESLLYYRLVIYLMDYNNLDL